MDFYEMFNQESYNICNATLLSIKTEQFNKHFIWQLTWLSRQEQLLYCSAHTQFVQSFSLFKICTI